MIKFLRSLALSVILLTSVGSIVPVHAESDNALADYYQSVVDNFKETIRNAQGNPALEVNVWYSYGQAQLYLGDFEGAKTSSETALKLVRQLEPEQRQLEYGILWQLATIHNHLGDNFGREFLEQEYQKPLDRYSYRLVVQQLAYAYTSISSASLYGRAVSIAQESVELARSDGQTTDVIDALTILAGLVTQKDRAQGIAILYEARELALILEQPQQTTYDRNTTIQLAQYLHVNEQSQRGIRLLSETIARAKQNAPDDLQNIWVLKMFQAGLYRDLGNYGQAAKIHQEREVLARQLVEKNGHFQLAWTLQDLSEVTFWQDNLSAALDYQTQAHEQLQLERVRLGQGDSLESSMAAALSISQQRLGFLLWRLNRDSEAEAQLKAALELDSFFRGDILDNLNQLNTNLDELTIGSYAVASDIHRLLQQIYLKQGRTQDALIASEQGRARGFLNLIRNRLETDPKYFDLNPPTLEEMKAIARREQTTIVQYSLVYDLPYYWRYALGRHQRTNTSQLIIWVIQPTGELTQTTVSLTETDLKELIRTMRRRLVSNARSNRAAQHLQHLHRLLIDPISPQLPRNPNVRVTFIPDDDLFFVPFPALQNADGVELIDRHTILTAPSIQVLGESRRNQSKLKSSDRAFIVGNPSMPSLPSTPSAGRSTLSPLPGAETEARAIAKILNTDPLIGPEATETRAVEEMQDAKIIHLATHGLLELGSHANSLALAPTDQDDGLLTVREIAPLELNAKLAVLSACDTGRGHNYYNGEGVIGLSRGFIGAGVASIVVSLWAIPDQPTATLMETFYTELNAGQDSAAALRTAMLKTREQYPSPSNWAAFTIMGAVD